MFDMVNLYSAAAPHPNPLPAGGERGRALIGAGSKQLAPFSPRAGRRCRQADEGHFHPKAAKKPHQAHLHQNQHGGADVR
ncbi:hypothetical protein SAMN03159407_1908 [Rhizobium sp. NFR12]|nr:hypothetical protein SAMN03159407_1908 [Rhizobium sp. NFR12]